MTWTYGNTSRRNTIWFELLPPPHLFKSKFSAFLNFSKPERVKEKKGGGRLPGFALEMT